MDTAPAAPAGAPDRTLPEEGPSIGVPSIPSRTDQDPRPAPVPSIPLPADPGPQARMTSSSTVAAVAARPPAAGTPPDPVDDTEFFPPAVRAKLKSYVYLLVDPRTGRPFHVGHGRDDRCFDHVRAAREGRRPARSDPAGEGGEHSVLDRIRQLEAAGRPVRVEILRYGLDPDQALTVEAAAHDVLGLPGVPAGESQRASAAEVRALLTKRAKFKRPHQVVLLRVGPVGTDASYERARHGWRIGRRWVDVEAPRSPHWAAVVVGELVDSIYRLDHWDAAPPGSNGTPFGESGTRTPERYSFVGTRDPELERRYGGKSVAPYLGRVSPGSASYVWCGPHWVNTAH